MVVLITSKNRERDIKDEKEGKEEREKEIDDE